MEQVDSLRAQLNTQSAFNPTQPAQENNKKVLEELIKQMKAKS